MDFVGRTRKEHIEVCFTDRNHGWYTEAGVDFLIHSFLFRIKKSKAGNGLMADAGLYRVLLNFRQKFRPYSSLMYILLNCTRLGGLTHSPSRLLPWC